jgi:hypothetical protein
MKKNNERLRPYLANSLLLFTSLIFSFLFFEAAFRIYYKVPFTVFPNFVSKELALLRGSGTSDSNIYDPLTGWTWRANNPEKIVPTGKPRSKICCSTGDYFLGDFGIRMNSYSISPVPKGAILVVGDSFAAGSEVEEPETFPAQLEKLLGKRVLNAGVAGFALDQTFLRTQMLEPILKPKQIIFSIFSEDILRNAYDKFSGGMKPFFTVENGILVHNNYPVPISMNSPGDIGFWQSVFGRFFFVHRLLRQSRWSAW